MAIDSCLVDTNILLRSSKRSDQHHQFVDAALSLLAQQGTVFYFTHQNIAELWNVITRPVDKNGFGLTITEAQQQLRAIETGMTLLPDNEAVYREWKNVVAQYRVSGVQTHDARLVASMYVHQIKNVLTLNVADFSRFDNVVALHPSEVH